MGKIAAFFGAPQALVVPVSNNHVLVDQPEIREVESNKRKNGPEVVLVQQGQDVDQVLRNVKHNNFLEVGKQYN